MPPQASINSVSYPKTLKPGTTATMTFTLSQHSTWLEDYANPDSFTLRFYMNGNEIDRKDVTIPNDRTVTLSTTGTIDNNPLDLHVELWSNYQVLVQGDSLNYQMDEVDIHIVPGTTTEETTQNHQTTPILDNLIPSIKSGGYWVVGLLILIILFFIFVIGRPIRR